MGERCRLVSPNRWEALWAEDGRCRSEMRNRWGEADDEERGKSCGEGGVGVRFEVDGDGVVGIAEGTVLDLGDAAADVVVVVGLGRL